MKVIDYREKTATNLLPKSLEDKFNDLELRKKELEKPLLCRRVIVKYFNPSGIGTWYILEGEKEPDGDYRLFGYCHLGDNEMAEFGYIYLSELQELRCPPFGAKIERDLFIDKDCSLYYALKSDNFPVKFGLGEYYEYVTSKYQKTSFSTEFSNNDIGKKLDEIINKKNLELVIYPDGMLNLKQKHTNRKCVNDFVYDYNQSDFDTIFYNLFCLTKEEKTNELLKQCVDKDFYELHIEYDHFLDFWVSLGQMQESDKKYFIKDLEEKYQILLAQNPNTTIDKLELLAKNKDCFIRKLVAENPNTPSEVLDDLFNDEDKDVYLAAKNNPNFMKYDDELSL